MGLLSFLRRVTRDPDRVPPVYPLPGVPLRAPPGFRFGSTPPSLDCLVHLDNDHPYHNAKAGEKLAIVEGAVCRTHVGYGEVVGRMDSDDPRAKASGVWPLTPGIYFRDETGELRWRPCAHMTFWRREDGVLQLLR